MKKLFFFSKIQNNFPPCSPTKICRFPKAQYFFHHYILRSKFFFLSTVQYTFLFSTPLFSNTNYFVFQDSPRYPFFYHWLSEIQMPFFPKLQYKLSHTYTHTHCVLQRSFPLFPKVRCKLFNSVLKLGIRPFFQSLESYLQSPNSRNLSLSLSSPLYSSVIQRHPRLPRWRNNLHIHVIVHSCYHWKCDAWPGGGGVGEKKKYKGWLENHVDRRWYTTILTCLRGVVAEWLGWPSGMRLGCIGERSSSRSDLTRSKHGRGSSCSVRVWVSGSLGSPIGRSNRVGLCNERTKVDWRGNGGSAEPPKGGSAPGLANLGSYLRKKRCSGRGLSISR